MSLSQGALSALKTQPSVTNITVQIIHPVNKNAGDRYAYFPFSQLKI